MAGCRSKQEEILSIEKFGGYKTGEKDRVEVKGKASAKKQGERGGTLGDITGPCRTARPF